MQFLVGYQLRTQASFRDYEHIDAALRLLEGSMIFHGQWIVRTEFDADGLCAYLRTFIEPADRLVICELSGTLRGWNLLEEPRMLQPDRLQHP
jgi:hypothetical protein